MTPSRTLGWRAAEAVVLGGVAYAVGFGLSLALVVALLALGVSGAGFVGERYGYPMALRHVALAVALVVHTALAVSAGARWFVVVALPLVAWFLLDALAQAFGADVGAGTDDSHAAVVADPDLAGELLRELRAEPQSPARLAATLDRSRPRVARTLDALAARGTLERDADGRYRVADAGGFDPLALPARLGERLREPLRLLL
ncbi:hypothetical protein [Halarchaeum sp. P4]|uniref:hypothetical protein n=1 Tax=Halarchaeum sp. P4 TaxID=3421639 RepID=UPI003EC0FE08